MKYLVKRNIGKTICPWLDSRIREGTVVYEYTGYTYGCISDTGVAVTFKEGVEPFFELPLDFLIPQP